MTTTRIKVSDLPTLETLQTYPLFFTAGLFCLNINLPQECVNFFFEKWHKKASCYRPESFVNFLNLYGKHGVEAALHPQHLPADSYWKIDAVSNSDLSALKDRLLGKPKQLGGRKFVFGACFHEQMLEPHIHNRAIFNLRPSEHYALDQMAKSLRKDSIFRKILPMAKTEITRVWKHEETGVLCKGKLDMWLEKYGEVVDLKTTSARTQKEFEMAMNSYDYDRQVFHYMEGAKATRLRIIGVQKIEPFGVFHFAREVDSDFVKRGKRKRNYLLQQYKAHCLS